MLSVAQTAWYVASWLGRARGVVAREGRAAASLAGGRAAAGLAEARGVVARGGARRRGRSACGGSSAPSPGRSRPG